MTPFLFRLLCLSLASFFVLHSLLSLSIVAVAPRIARAARRMRPDAAARLLFRLRMIPCALSFLLVAGLVIPSFVMLEPESENEAVGALCIVAAILGSVLLIVPTARALRAGLASVRLGRAWRIAGRRVRIAEAPAPVYVINEDRPVLALHGIVSPLILISSGTLGALSPELLAAAMRHESAHLSSHDNLRKLALILAPGMFPFVHGFGSLERNWAQAAEWAADDRAAAGSAASAVALAEALVRIARMSDGPGLPLLTTSLLSRCAEFAFRVERLLEPQRTQSVGWIPGVSILMVVMLAAAALLLRYDAFHAVHQLLERFIQ